MKIILSQTDHSLDSKLAKTTLCEKSETIRGEYQSDAEKQRITSFVITKIGQTDKPNPRCLTFVRLVVVLPH